ncbi:RnfH family protein [Vogesella oryzae]|uniref:RnfH family protein n=1 Tax=Vogesella oryzae TaxID=1735285 RepID=UPI001582BDCE|nr:RnfH family protein [Vogesella oryzae]
MTERIQVEVAFALPARQKIVSLQVAPGTTALQAVELSGLAAEFAEIDLGALKLGIFSKAVKPETVLREHDRVEIYRPLLADPKEVRRQRAEAGKVTKKGGAE